MATIVMESIGRVFISLQQIRQVPQLLTDAAPSMPGTVRDTEVPSYFRERYVCTGYRPLNKKLALLLPCCSSLTGRKVRPCSLLLLLSGLRGVAQYQCGSAVVHFYYAVDESVHGLVSGIFMPTATILSCLSCLGCCYGKYCNHSLPTGMPTAAVHSCVLCLGCCYSKYYNHILLMWMCKICQVVCSFFFTCPLPEVCFPGCSWNRDIKMSMFIFCCLMYQTHTFELEYMSSGKLYSNLHGICVAALFVGLYTCSHFGFMWTNCGFQVVSDSQE
uniref:Progestin and adipoQ receptor family member VII, a n=1 Tax=Oreochromis aureus TaxID=47969 RepID=A0AAZ1X9A3_OREAU